MESHADTALRWIVLVPLLGTVVNGLLNRRLPRQVAGLLACATVGVSFVLSVMLFLRLTGMPAEGRLLTDTIYTWIGFENLRVDIAFTMGSIAVVASGIEAGEKLVVSELAAPVNGMAVTAVEDEALKARFAAIARNEE